MSWILRRFFLYQSHGAIFGGGTVYDPRLDFSDARNSQYLGSVI